MDLLLLLLGGLTLSIAILRYCMDSDDIKHVAFYTIIGVIFTVGSFYIITKAPTVVNHRPYMDNNVKISSDYVQLKKPAVIHKRCDTYKLSILNQDRCTYFVEEITIVTN